MILLGTADNIAEVLSCTDLSNNETATLLLQSTVGRRLAKFTGSPKWINRLVSRDVDPRGALWPNIKIGESVAPPLSMAIVEGIPHFIVSPLSAPNPLLRYVCHLCFFPTFWAHGGRTDIIALFMRCPKCSSFGGKAVYYKLIDFAISIDIEKLSFAT